MKTIEEVRLGSPVTFTQSDYNGASYSGTFNFTRKYLLRRGTGPRPKPEGFLPMTDYYLSTYEYSNLPTSLTHGYLESYKGGPPFHYWWTFDGIFPMYVDFLGETRMPSSISLANARNGVTTRALAGLKQGDFSLSVALAEMPETVGMIANRAVKFARFADAVKKKRYKRARRLIGAEKSASDHRKSSHDFMLETQYGWLPLLSDIHSGYELITKGFSEEGWYVTSSSQHSLVERSNEWRGPYVWNGIAATYSYETKVDVGTVIVARVSNPALYAAAGVGLTNPLLLKWELTKLSFVVDWLVPVGDLLSALDATLGLEFVTGCHTEFIKTSNFVTPAMGIKKGTSRWQVTNLMSEGVSGNYEAVKYTRTAIKSFPWPVPYYNNEPLSARRALAALNLIGQGLKL